MLNEEYDLMTARSRIFGLEDELVSWSEWWESSLLSLRVRKQVCVDGMRLDHSSTRSTSTILFSDIRYLPGLLVHRGTSVEKRKKPSQRRFFIYTKII